MLELGVGVELCAPRSGNQKGAVENLVGWVKGSFFKCRRFLDEADLQTQLAEWLVYANTERPSRATGKVPLEAKKDETPRLRPLKVAPDQLALRIPVVVGPTGYVSHNGALYSMPPEAIGIAGTVYLYPHLVTIVAGRFEATHLRQPSGGQSTLPEHRVEHVAAVSGKRGKRYLERQHLLALGDGELPEGLDEEQLFELYRTKLKELCGIPHAADLAIPHPTIDRTKFRLVVGGKSPAVVSLFRDIEKKVIGAEAAVVRETAAVRECEERTGQLVLLQAPRMTDVHYDSLHGQAVRSAPHSLIAQNWVPPTRWRSDRSGRHCSNRFT
jgi:hypothetical protein